MRAIWRLAAAVALFMVIETVLGMAVLGNHPVYRWLRSQPRGVLSPLLLFLTESVGVGAALLTGLAMSKLEGRTFADYGIPWREALGKRFWQGVMFGFAMLGLLMASIAAGHGFSLGGRALGVREAIWFGAQYAVGFLLVGFFEEGTFRGYMQATLGADIGFWPAALILSAWFELIHVRNSGEAIVGLFMAGCFGLLACFSLWRTGDIWFAIGMHAAWDWGQTFFLGVPDSGATATGHLMNSSLHGPVWLAGGTAGPEGSVFVFGVMALAAVALYFVFPAERKTGEAAAQSF